MHYSVAHTLTAAMGLMTEDYLFDYAESLGFGDVHTKIDRHTGLRAIIAIHSTKLGPSLGGCRFLEYPSSADALKDALNLAQAMSYKAALLNLPLGGGKAVIMRPKQISNYEAFFTSFGDFVESLNGRYITAADSGTTAAEMDIIEKRTRFVTGHSATTGSPSPSTATGVRRGIEAAVKFKLDKDSLEGIHVAIQGVGQVGYNLAKELYERGAQLTVTDINPEAVTVCQKEFAAKTIAIDEIHKVECDVFAPCALGGAINKKTLPELNTSIIAGAANNQLANPEEGETLHQRGILYAPDYVVNGGGLAFVGMQYYQEPPEKAQEKINGIYDTLLKIFARSQQEDTPTSQIADAMAQEKL